MPIAGHHNTMSQDLRPSQGRSMDRKTNLSQNQINKPPQPPSYNNSSVSLSSQVIQQSWSDPYEPGSLDLSIYPSPHPASPLSKHLNKLLPPNESIINFFNTLFQ